MTLSMRIMQRIKHGGFFKIISSFVKGKKRKRKRSKVCERSEGKSKFENSSSFICKIIRSIAVEISVAN